MPTPGKLEITIKLTSLPADVATDANGWKSFAVDCDGVAVTTRLRPKMWTKLEEAARQWPSWVAALTGKMGERSAEGFVLLEPAIQVFEKKAKSEPGAAG